MFALLQYLLPKYLLTRIVWSVARIRNVRFKNWLITRFVDLYKVNVDEVDQSVPADFDTFNDFFIRELSPDARPVDDATDSIVSPADGKVSQCGEIDGNRLIQAKGIHYSVEDLLAVDTDNASAYQGGSFATIYLAPFNYHRVHAPLGGRISAMHYVPGDLFSVNDATARGVKGLFRRNERLNVYIKTANGTFTLVFVGALNVGSITTPWTGEIRPRKKGVVDAIDLSGQNLELIKGDLLGWFNMGSTVILLSPAGAMELDSSLSAGKVLSMGEKIGRLSDQ